jgi:drug/metabolite transporter (DMT)-like permease
VIFATAPLVGALFSLPVLGEVLTPSLALAAGLMAAGVGLLLREQHSQAELSRMPVDRPFWHAHEHLHSEKAHAHPHVSDAHHRHRH